MKIRAFKPVSVVAATCALVALSSAPALADTRSGSISCALGKAAYISATTTGSPTQVKTTYNITDSSGTLHYKVYTTKGTHTWNSGVRSGSWEINSGWTISSYSVTCQEA